MSGLPGPGSKSFGLTGLPFPNDWPGDIQYAFKPCLPGLIELA